MRTTRNGRRAWGRLLRLGVRAKAVVAAGVIVTSGSSAVLPAESSLQISVYVYNGARVPARTLMKAQDGAAKIFEKAGIKITWREPRPSVAEGADASDPWVPTNIEVRIFKRHMIDEVPVKEEVTGFVWSFETNTAAILYDRVQNLAASKLADVTPILGIVMAHEIAHLLLRSGEHSFEGIMRRNWSSGDLQSAAQGRLRFTAEQSRRMRDDAIKGSAQPPGTLLKIEIHVYNYSSISGEALARAEQETVRIFQHIGVLATWRVCPLTSQEAVHNRACAPPDAPTKLTLRLLSNSMADSFRGGGDVFGSALLPENEGFGTVANVYADRTRELADGREFEVILGCVIAHELGHLLLGKNEHSAAGIMHARWGAQDLGLSRQAAMLFLPGEANRIRAQVFARTIREPSLTSVELATANLSAASSEVFVHETSSTAVPAECLNIHLYNLAGVSSRTLDSATQDAARVLATAGVNKVCWHVLAEAQEAHTLHTSPPPTWRKNRQTDSRGYLVAVIVSGVPVDYFPGALGYALPDAEIGVNAMIFYDRIQRFKASGEIALPTLLGHAMAHEIGHVLLGTIEHSPAGIMKARWSKADFEVAGLRFMTFTALQGAEVRCRGLIARQQISAVSSEQRMNAVAAAAPEPGSVTGSTQVKLVVSLYDYAQVPSRVLTGAEHETARVFQIAGIQLSWVECGLSEADKERFLDCEHVTDPMRLFVNIVPQLVALGLPPGKFGTSLGTHAVVFNRQVEKTAADRGLSKDLILGYVMAHELGHLLLGENSHGQGIMTGSFGRRAFELAEKGKLVFTPQQAEQMRARILGSS